MSTPSSCSHPVDPDQAASLLLRTTEVLSRAVGLPGGGIKPGSLARRLATQVSHLGLPRLLGLLTQTEQGDTQALATLRTLLTVNYSCFWREPQHWPILREHLQLKLSQGQAVSLWSAACADGEEAYSMAMVTSDVAGQTGHEGASWRILASDIDTQALATARQGLYPPSALGELPALLRTRYLRPVRRSGHELWQVLPALQAGIDFRYFDLTPAEWPALPGQPFDVIFLSNVLIYLAKPIQMRILEHTAACLRPDGIVLTSRSEGRLDSPHLRACGDCAYILAPATRRL